MRALIVTVLLLTLGPSAIAVAGVATPAPHGTPTCPSGEFPSAGALDITEGTVVWAACSPDETYRAVIGASDSIVLIDEQGPDGMRTVAFDAGTGVERWHRSIGSVPFPPGLPIAQGPFDGQGIVVLTTDDVDGPALVGVDAMTGDERWRVASPDVPLAHSSTVAVVGDVPSPGAAVRFHGIDRSTGEELWVGTTPLIDMSGVFVARAPVAVLDDVVVVPTGATVTAMNMGTGATLWQAPQLDHPVAADGVIIGMRGANEPPHAPSVAALDAVSGNQLWTAPGRPSYGDLLAAGDDMVAVLDPESGDIIAYEVASGTERWRVMSSLGQPQLISATSLVLLWEGEVAVLSTTDGSTTWSATEPFGSPLMNSVGVNGETVFVAINSRPWMD